MSDPTPAPRHSVEPNLATGDGSDTRRAEIVGADNTAQAMDTAEKAAEFEPGIIVCASRGRRA